MKKAKIRILTGAFLLFVFVWLGSWAHNRYESTWMNVPIIFSIVFSILFASGLCLIGVIDMIIIKYPAQEADTNWPLREPGKPEDPK